MSHLRLTVAASLLIASGAATPAAAADAVKGKIVFARCAICHDVKPGVNKLGPSLAKLFGRKAGTVTGYSYSAAMKQYGKVWNAQSLDAYITAPMKAVPGTKMAFAGIANPTDRANLIAYLQTATK